MAPITRASISEADRPLKLHDFYVHTPEGVWKYLTGDDYDPLAIVPVMPHTGIGYMVEEDGFAHAFVTIFELSRLMHIRQLGFIAMPFVDTGNRFVVSAERFIHTRYVHSLDTYTLASLMAANARLGENAGHTLRTAALLHDAATPAGGDTTKLIDPARFDEETNFVRYLEQHSQKGDEMLASLGISREMLIATVQGQGLLGEFLDLADKVAYVGRDTGACIGLPMPYLPREFQTIRQLLETHPTVCDIWDCVREADGHAVIADPDRLATFLRLQILLFRGLYWNTWARYLEFVLGKTILQFLYDRQVVSAEQLLDMGDDEIDLLIGKVISHHWLGSDLAIYGQPRCKTFSTKAAALAYEAQLLASGHAITVVEKFGRNIKAGTDLWTLVNGRAVPFREARPQVAEQIKTLTRIKKTYRVYVVDGVTPSDLFLKVLDVHRRTRDLT